MSNDHTLELDEAAKPIIETIHNEIMVHQAYYEWTWFSYFICLSALAPAFIAWKISTNIYSAIVYVFILKPPQDA